MDTILCAAGMETGSVSRKMIARGGHMAAVMDWLLPQHSSGNAMPQGWGEAGASEEAGPSNQEEDPSAQPPPPQVAKRPAWFPARLPLLWLACRHITAPLLGNS